MGELVGKNPLRTFSLKMPFKKLYKKSAKFTRPIKKTFRKRYVRKTGALRYAKLAKDVMKLKSMVNAEKKEVRTYQSAAIAVGQCNINVDNAYWQQDITPIISQGVQDGQRNGDTVKIHAILIKGQIQQQSGAVLPQRLKFYVVMVKGTPETVSINNLLVQNPQTLCTDWNSIRNKDRFKNYYIVREKTFRMKSDQYSGQGSTFIDFKIPLRFSSYHLNYLSATNTVSNGQLILYVVADSGNINAATPSTLAVPVLQASSGSALSYTCDAWYYDN